MDISGTRAALRDATVRNVTTHRVRKMGRPGIARV